MGELYEPFPKLPKNFRQIGERDQVLKLYLEDYVNTYLKRLQPAKGADLRVGLLLGSRETHEDIPFVFVDGALEMDSVTEEGGKVAFTEDAWKKAYQDVEQMFPKRTVQGWFLCAGPGCTLSPLTYWKQHSQYFTGKNQLMYLNCGLEGEEAVYITSSDGFYKLRGYSIYYERNQMMQDYMVTRKDVRRVESGSHEKVIKDFRQRMTVRKEQADAGRHMSGILGTACGVLTVAVLAGGVVLVNNYHKMRQMETVLTSVVPAGTANWSDYLDKLNQEPDFVIEERPGNVFPTDESRETGESYAAETMEATEAGTNSKSSEVSESTGNPETTGVLGQSAASSQPDNPDTAASTGKPGTDGTETAAASGAVEEAVPPTSAEAPTSPRVGMGKEEGQGDASGQGKEPVDYAAAAANGYRIYEIGDGETLYGICWKEYGNLKRLSEICALNHLDDVNHIVAGQKLVLP